MKMKTALFVTAATLAMAPAAHAYQGLYGAIGAGLNYMQDVDIESDDGLFAFDSQGDFNSGIGVYTALGYDTGANWRFEVELAYRNNDIDNMYQASPGFAAWPTGTIGGDVTTFSLMANALYDLPWFNSDRFQPYIGGGVGFADVDPDIVGNNPAPGGSAIAWGSNKRMLAYQGIAGVAVGLAEGLALDVSYRYFGTQKREYLGALAGAPAQVRMGYGTHSLFAGLRWAFGAAAPITPQYKDCWDGSAVPVSAECPPQDLVDEAVDLDDMAFTVYFDYDKSNLTPEASSLIAEASSRALSNEIDVVNIAGNTDTSGSSAYNQALSQRRANAVRDALIANGVPGDMINMDALGESNPAKATADGVREPLNRRADVTISFE